MLFFPEVTDNLFLIFNKKKKKTQGPFAELSSLLLLTQILSCFSGPNTTGARVPGREAAGSEAEGLSVLRREPGRAVFYGCRPSP